MNRSTERLREIKTHKGFSMQRSGLWRILEFFSLSLWFCFNLHCSFRVMGPVVIFYSQIYTVSGSWYTVQGKANVLRLQKRFLQLKLYLHRNIYIKYIEINKKRGKAIHFTWKVKSNLLLCTCRFLPTGFTVLNDFTERSNIKNIYFKTRCFWLHQLQNRTDVFFENEDEKQQKHFQQTTVRVCQVFAFY